MAEPSMVGWRAIPHPSTKNFILPKIEQIEPQKDRHPWTTVQFERPQESLKTFNNLAHSLRSPLNTILGHTQVLLDQIPGEINTIQKRYLTNIYENGKLLLQMVNEIIVWLKSRTKGQGQGFLRTKFTLNQILEDVYRNPTSLIQIKNLKITVIDSETPIHVWGDPHVVEEILHNLMQVLAQIASNGSAITVEVGKSNEEAEIRFLCHLIGVEVNDLEQTIRNILESEALPNFRDTAGTRRLPTMKELVEAQNGGIRANFIGSSEIEMIMTLPISKREHFSV